MVHSRDALIPGGDLSALIARLEATEGPSDEIDFDLARWLYANPSMCGALVNYDPELWVIRNGGWTDSVNAALVLAEWVFPGWYVGVQPWFHTDPDRVMSRAYLIRPDWKLWNPVGDDWCDQHHGRSCATPALAVVAAILRAVQHGYEAAGEVSPNLKAKAQGEGG